MSIDHHTSRSGFDTDLADLRAALARMTFPALQDEVLAALVARRAPMRLLWRVGSLSPTRLYRSADEVCADIARLRGGPRRTPGSNPGSGSDSGPGAGSGGGRSR